MDIINKILQLRQKKEQERKDNCPTSAILYIATGMRSHKTINPWYDRIKELADGATFHQYYFHSAVVYGMYPELENACKDFAQSMQEIYQSKENVSENEKEKIEKSIIKKYGLQNSYNIGTLTPEQQSRVDANKASAMKRYVDEETKKLNPTVQVLAQALRSTLPSSEPVEHKFVNYFNFIDIALGHEEYFKEVQSKYPKDKVGTINQIFELRQQGILDKDYKIVDYNAFKESSLVKSFSYQGQKYDITQNIMPQNMIANIRQNDWSL